MCIPFESDWQQKSEFIQIEKLLMLQLANEFLNSIYS